MCIAVKLAEIDLNFFVAHNNHVRLNEISRFAEFYYGAILYYVSFCEFTDVYALRAVQFQRK